MGYAMKVTNESIGKKKDKEAAVINKAIEYAKRKALRKLK